MVTSYCYADQNNPENFWLRYNQAANDTIAKAAQLIFVGVDDQVIVDLAQIDAENNVQTFFSLLQCRHAHRFLAPRPSHMTLVKKVYSSW